MGAEQLEQTIADMKHYADAHHVPIMEDEGMEQLLALLTGQQPEKILEIGSAIGFSAIKMAQSLPDCHIDTIERDGQRYEKAVQFIGQSGLSDKIRIFQGDALEMDISSLDKDYDAIFIDAAKGQYERFFEKYEVLLANGGVVYCDNMHMHGLAELPMADVPKRKRTMIRNLKKFRDHMMEHPAYDTQLLNQGDGIMVCRKK
ncbi:O-methyltransferase [Planococcus salinus]|uniref:O-methyltransferase n=1 Tax=Planococcus salinus TaxID=1848460 RepID=A0A3M8PBH4_9BACL|nr:O-methyltransferase [Planococcus salinus]RNF40983.1 O-methyltransferase [Planococcus salinus]